MVERLVCAGVLALGVAVACSGGDPATGPSAPVGDADPKTSVDDGNDSSPGDGEQGGDTHGDSGDSQASGVDDRPTSPEPTASDWINPAPTGAEVSDASDRVCLFFCESDVDCCAFLDAPHRLATACQRLCGGRDDCCKTLAASDGCPNIYPWHAVCGESNTCNFRGCQKDEDCARTFGSDFSCFVNRFNAPFGTCGTPCPESRMCADGGRCEDSPQGSAGTEFFCPFVRLPRNVMRSQQAPLSCESSSECVEALAELHAVDPQIEVRGPICSPDGICIACTKNEDCVHSPGGPRCDVATGRCVCCEDSECPDDHRCGLLGTPDLACQR